MAQLLQVAQLGQQILRQKAAAVQHIHDATVQQLINNLLATVMDVNGVGIAAPQVYESQRIIIVASHHNPRYPHAPKMEPTPMIKPRILRHGKKKIKDWEGCLSIPGIRGLIPRYDSITVTYTNRNGVNEQKEFSDFIARIVQHEIDHLNGILFIDRVESSHDLISDKEYLKLIANKTSH